MRLISHWYYLFEAEKRYKVTRRISISKFVCTNKLQIGNYVWYFRLQMLSTNLIIANFIVA